MSEKSDKEKAKFSFMQSPNYKTMKIQEIAKAISSDWQKVNYAAKPYLEAMFRIDSSGNYGMDSWESVTGYFLSNASGWRGDVAKEVKKELKRRLKTRKMNG